MKNKQTTLALGASVAASASLLAATSSERYVYDASGNIVEKQIGDQVTQFDYSGNLLKGSLLDATQKQYQYDNAGRLVGESEEGQEVRRLNYQFADKVTRVQSGDRTTELFYNAEGQLVGTSSAGNLEAFAWDGLALVSRGEQAYANEKHVVGGVPAMVGSEVAVSDMIGNTLSIGEESFESTAYGEGKRQALFTGKPYISQLGSFVFRHRNYSPVSNRWDVSDPIGYPDGRNQFQYVQSDPILKVDPEGLATRAFQLSTVWGVTGVTTTWDGKHKWNFDPCEASVFADGGFTGPTSLGASGSVGGVNIGASHTLFVDEVEYIDEEIHPHNPNLCRCVTYSKATLKVESVWLVVTTEHDLDSDKEENWGPWTEK